MYYLNFYLFVLCSYALIPYIDKEYTFLCFFYHVIFINIIVNMKTIKFFQTIKKCANFFKYFKLIYLFTFALILKLQKYICNFNKF